MTDYLREYVSKEDGFIIVKSEKIFNIITVKKMATVICRICMNDDLVSLIPVQKGDLVESTQPFKVVESIKAFEE